MMSMLNNKDWTFEHFCIYQIGLVHALFLYRLNGDYRSSHNILWHLRALTELTVDCYTWHATDGAWQSESNVAGRRKHCFHPVLLPASPPQPLQTLQHVLLRDEQEEDEEAIERIDQVKDEEEEMMLNLEWWSKMIIVMQCNAMQWNAMQCNAMQWNEMQCNAMQCNAMQCTEKLLTLLCAMNPFKTSSSQGVPLKRFNMNATDFADVQSPCHDLIWWLNTWWRKGK